MQNFLNTAVGSYVKTLLSVILTLVLIELQKGNSVTSIDWTTIANGALISLLPVLINALNPADKRYGRKKKTV